MSDLMWCPYCHAERRGEDQWLFAPTCEDCGTQLDHSPPDSNVDFKEVLDTSLDDDQEDADAGSETEGD